MSFALASACGAAGALQQPFATELFEPYIAAQQPRDAAGAEGALQHAGRPAASTGANANEATRAATSLLRFIIGSRPVKIPAGAPGGKP